MIVLSHLESPCFRNSGGSARQGDGLVSEMSNFFQYMLRLLCMLFLWSKQKNFEPSHMALVSSSLKVALTCYAGSFEIIFSSPFLNHKNILPAQSMSQQIYDKPLDSSFPLVRCECIFTGNGSLSMV